MKRIAALALSICCTMPAWGSSDCKLSPSEILASRPCKARQVVTTGYLNSSQHGAWISESVGAAKRGVFISLDPTAQNPSMKQIKNFVFRPQDYLNKTFHAEFSGTIQCGNAKGALPTLKVRKAEKIQISKISG